MRHISSTTAQHGQNVYLQQQSQVPNIHQHQFYQHYQAGNQNEFFVPIRDESSGFWPHPDTVGHDMMQQEQFFQQQTPGSQGQNSFQCPPASQVQPDLLQV